MTMPATNEHSMEDCDRLILRYLDDSLSPTEVARVLELLEDPHFQLRLANYALDQTELHEAPQLALATERCSADRSAAPGRLRRQSRTAGRWVAAAAVAAIATATVVALRSPRSDSSVGLPRLQRAIGEVAVDGRPAVAGASVGVGQSLHTLSPTSFAALRFADGSEIQLAGETIVACRELDKGKDVRVLAGNVSASVQPQAADKPLMIHTPSASMEVLGTDLAVSASPEQTRLHVTTGSVRMHRLADQDSVVVNRGEFAVASRADSLEPQQAANAPDQWSVDFTDGTPAGWQGAFVAGNGLGHNGSLRAVRTAADRPHTITSTHAWSEGLFRIQADTCVNYRIKLARPQWYQIILCVRDDHYRPANGQPIHECQEVIDFSQVPAGAWRTVSMPISSFRLPQQTTERFTERPDHPPAPGSTAFLLLFAALEEDPGLEIDRIWVTRGPPPAEERLATVAIAQPARNALRELADIEVVRLPGPSAASLLRSSQWTH